MFVESIHTYLIWASLAAVGLGVILSYVLTRRVLTSLFQMAESAKQIAAGNYTVTVPVLTKDEIGQLAETFNTMAMSLQSIEQRCKTLVINVAHDLRTPLTNIRGYLEALSDGVVPPSKGTFDLLQEETMRLVHLVHLVEEVLQLARADAARTTLQTQSCNVNALITPILDLFQSRFLEKGIQVETAFAPEIHEVTADPEKLTQVVHNLLHNAWQYTRHGGRLEIRTESDNEQVRFVFANTGEGIAPQDLPHIFERFYSGEKSRSRERAGTGIGLAIVKEVIEAHGGAVGADSSSQETRVWFSLPL